MTTHRITRTIGVLGVLGLAAVGCQAQAPVTLSDVDKEALGQAADAWAQAANAGDFAALASYYAEDAILLPTQAETVRGRAAIQEFFTGFPPFSDMTLEQVEIDGRADLAYVWGTYSMMVTLPGASEPTLERGKYIEIWRKQADGSWKISRDIYNSDLPGADM